MDKSKKPIYNSKLKYSSINPTLQNLLNLRNQTKKVKKDETIKQIEKTKIKKLINSNGLKKMINYSLKDDIEEFKKFGEGLYFYFYFLKFFTKIFLILSIIALVPLILNLLGNGIERSGENSILLKTTISNTNKIKDSELLKFENNFKIGTKILNLIKKESIDKNFYVQMISDMLIMAILYFSYIIFKIQINKQSKDLKTVNLSVKNYSLWIKGLPNSKINENELRKFFNKFFKVKKCAFAYKFTGCLGNMLKVGQIKNLIQTEKSVYTNKKYILEKKLKEKKLKLKKFNKKLKNLEKKINKKKFRLKKKLKLEILKIENKLQKETINIDNLNSFDIHSAFITFNDPLAPKKLKKMFKKEYSKKNWKTILLCKKIILNKDYLFKNKKLRLHTPDHPTNIYWENIEYSKTSRFLKLCLIIIASIIVIIISIIFNILFTSLINVRNCKGKNNFSLKEIFQTALENQNELLYCYCSSRKLSDIFNNEKLKKNCKFFLKDKFFETLVNIGIGVFLAVINLLIKLIVFYLIKFVKYASKVKVAIRKTFLIFIVSYINTAFILCLMYQRFFGISVIDEFNKILGGFSFIDVRFYVKGLNRSWYNKIGSKLLFTIFISIFVPQLAELFSQIISNWIKKIRSKKAKTRRDFIKILSPSSFHLENKFADVLRVIFVGITFSTGIPLGIIAIFLSLLITFWTHKFICIKFSRKPALYSIKLIKSVINIIPFCIFIHFFFGIYILTNENIYPFTLKDSDFDLYIENINKKHFLNDLLLRCYKILPYTILFIFFIILYFFEKFFTILFFIILRKKKSKDLGNLRKYDECYKEIAYYSLPNYNMALNPKYKNILKLSFPLFYKIKSFILAGNSINKIISKNNLCKINKSLFPDTIYDSSKINKSIFPNTKNGSKINKKREKSHISKFEIIVDNTIKSNIMKNIKNNPNNKTIFKNKLIIEKKNENNGDFQIEEDFQKKDVLSENVFKSDLNCIEGKIEIKKYKKNIEDKKEKNIDYKSEKNNTDIKKDFSINKRKNSDLRSGNNNDIKINFDIDNNSKSENNLNFVKDFGDEKIRIKKNKSKKFMIFSNKKNKNVLDKKKIKTMIFKKNSLIKKKIKTYDNLVKEVKIEDLKNIKIISNSVIIKQKEVLDFLIQNENIKSSFDNNIKREILKKIELKDNQEIEIDNELDYDYCDESIFEIIGEENLSENEEDLSDFELSEKSENSNDFKSIENFNGKNRKDFEKEIFSNNKKILIMDSFQSESFLLNKTEKSIIQKNIENSEKKI